MIQTSVLIPRGERDGLNGFAQQRQRRYICIDLKSFYASVECVERGLGPAEGGPGRSRSHANREDNLPGGIAVAEGEGRAQPLPRVRDPRRDGLRHGSPADAAVYRLFRPHLPDIAAVFLKAGHPRVFHRRVFHGCDGLFGAVRHERPRPGVENPLGDTCGNGHPRHMRHGNEPVSGEDRAGYHGEAQPGFLRQPGRGRLSGDVVGA
jgi:hypothetical protein